MRASTSPMMELSQLAGGNPGATIVLLEILKFVSEVDPDSSTGGRIYFECLRQLPLKESKIWVLFSDVCKKNIYATMGILRAYQMSLITREDILTAVAEAEVTRESSLDVKGILEKVKAVVPHFQTEAVE